MIFRVHQAPTQRFSPQSTPPLALHAVPVLCHTPLPVGASLVLYMVIVLETLAGLRVRTGFSRPRLVNLRPLLVNLVVPAITVVLPLLHVLFAVLGSIVLLRPIKSNVRLEHTIPRSEPRPLRRVLPVRLATSPTQPMLNACSAQSVLTALVALLQ